MYYPDDLIEEIRLKNDIVEVISDYVKLKKTGGSYVGLCPFHNEKTPSFSVSPSKQMYHCFGCGEGGNVFTFLMKYENDTFIEAVTRLAERAGIDLPKAKYTNEEKIERDIKAAILEVNKEAAKFYYHQLRSPNGEQGYKYFKERGLSDETMIKFGLGYSLKYSNSLYEYLKKKGFTDDIMRESGLIKYSEKGVYDAFWNRVMYPIMNNANKVIGFGGRVLGDGKPKYINSPETKVFDKSRNLYGLNIARSSRRGNMILCEGYMDVIALHQAGVDNAVASLGTAFTTGHAHIIKKYTDQVLLTFDSDGAGVKAALRAIPMLRAAGLSVKVINMRPYKDPDELIKNMGKEEFEKRIMQAENAFIYEIRMLMAGVDLKDPDEKTGFYGKVADRLLLFPDEMERNVYLDAVCEEFMIPKESMERLVYKKSLTYTGEVVQSRADENKKNTKKLDDGVKQSQKILLTWLIEDNTIYEKIKTIITEADFIDPFYNKVAALLFEQLRNGDVKPARILNNFTEEKEQNEAAGMFHASLSEGLSGQEKEKSLNEIIKKVKNNSLDYISNTTTDVEVLQNTIKEKAKLRNLHISI